MKKILLLKYDSLLISESDVNSIFYWCFWEKSREIFKNSHSDKTEITLRMFEDLRSVIHWKMIINARSNTTATKIQIIYLL